MKYAKRMETLQSAVFQRLDLQKQELLRQGKEVFNFSIGTPDLPPPAHVVAAVTEAAGNPENYKYAVQDLPELKQAVIDWYQRRYGVTLSAEMILALNGSQDGLAHIGLALANPGDIVLVPDPGYPVFNIGPQLAGAELVRMPLEKKNDYLIDFSQIDPAVATKAKYMIVSYPSNPVAAVAPDSFIENLIDFAKGFGITIVYDNAYSEFDFRGKGKSFLSFNGASAIGVEFNSLSKSYNLSGGRIAFAIGNAEIIEQLRVLKSHLDYGVFLPVQYGAIAALNGPQDCVESVAKIYRERMEMMVAGLNRLGWQAEKSAGTMFLWVPIPKSANSDETFAYELLQKTGVIAVPGSAFGNAGKGFLRFAMVQPLEIIERALEAMSVMSFS